MGAGEHVGHVDIPHAHTGGVKVKVKGDGGRSTAEGAGALEEVRDVKVDRDGKGILKAGEEASVCFACTEV